MHSIDIQANPTRAREALDLGQQARLADAGLAFDEQHRTGPARPRRSSNAVIRSTSSLRPTSRPGDGGRGSAYPPRPMSPSRRPDPDRLGLAAQDDRPAVRDEEPAACRRDGRQVEEDLAGRASDWIRAAVVIARAGEPRSSRLSLGALGRDHLAGRDPDPDLERLAAFGQATERGTDAQAGHRGPDGVVVVGARPAEDGEDGVADELLARTVVPGDDIGHDREGRSDPLADILRIVLGHHPDVVDEVGEERRDDPPVTGVTGTNDARASSPARAVPHRPQKRASAGLSVPQAGQRTRQTPPVRRALGARTA